jgi:anti-sigma factor RsiW
MRCDRSRELISPFVDGELSGEDRQAVAAHIEACANCAVLLADIQHMSEAIAGVGREPAPKTLALRVRSTLASAAQDTQQGKKRPALLRVPSNIIRQAGMLAACCALSVLLTWSFMTSTGKANRLEQEILTAHIRSLLQDSPIQVASSDAHNVKPWFAGRVDFAPDVKDLTGEGFPLLGGRLDYVGERRVGTLVYRRRLHVVNVFMWPAPSRDDVAPRPMTKNGYNLLAWSKSGVTYWAISDVDAPELERLQSLF